MSNHPYRQKLPTSGSSTSSPANSQYHTPQINPQPTMDGNHDASTIPYPINDELSASVSQVPIIHQQSLIPQPPQSAEVLHTDVPEVAVHHQGDDGQLPDNFHQLNLNKDLLGQQHQFNNSPKFNKSPHTIPYPYDDVTNTPPPIFNPQHNITNAQVPITNITSPNSNPLSATSSVTNFQLPPANIDPSFSKSENNLALSNFKHKHDRSVSSSSSFFDKSDNISMVDFNQNLITQYLGDNSNHLMPRIKTIELYRKNAKKSNDPTVLFQYAQYMLQTALLLDKDGSQTSSQNGNSPVVSSVENSPFRGPVDGNPPSNLANTSASTTTNNTPSPSPFKKSHRKAVSSLDLSNISEDSIDDKQLKKSLLKEATIYLKKLSDKGYTAAQYLLGDAFSSGAIGKIDNKEAFALFQSAAKHGHVESAYRTSYCYEEGLGTGRDARKAIEYLKMAALKNHAAAMYKLGVYSFYGRMGLGNDVNTKKMGIKWLERSSSIANELIAAAPFELGKIYYDGFKDILIQDKKYALELYSQAAALGHIESSAKLGHYYEVGEIVPQDSNLSIHYYTQAALGGDPNSMLAMCAWYLVGNEPYLPKDESESFEWAKRAAVCGLPKGQFALANFYDKGIGCIKDPQEAQKWYIKAAEQGDEKAITRVSDKEVVNKLAKKMKKKSFTHAKKDPAQDKDCVIV